VAESVADALRAAVASLRERAPAIDTPDTDAEELLSRLLGTTRAQLRAPRSRTLSANETKRMAEWLERRVAGEPVQYITGRAAFRDLDLAVDARVLIPRPETEGLVEFVLQALEAEARRWPNPRVLDLGTGSGAIALAVAAECPRAIVTATDASADALALARANARALRLDRRVRFFEGDWFEAIGADDRFEVVVSNPPYISTTERPSLPRDVRDFEPAKALFSGVTGLEALIEIVDDAPRHLVTGGLLALELAETRAREVASWFEGARDWSQVELRDDLCGQPRVLLARRERGPAIAPQQWSEEPPPR
jgi:release factor glutamine methyltransferase